MEQLIGFVQQAQDAKISLERLNEIYEVADEETPLSTRGESLSRFIGRQGMRGALGAITIKDLSFTYAGAGNEPVLRNINLCIYPKVK